jgi:iron complex outermembrane receptor protein
MPMRSPPTTIAACAPVNPFGRGNISAAATNYIRGTQQSFSTNKLDSAGVELQGDLFSLWAGPLTIAVGAEARWEEQVASRGALSQITPAIFGPLTVFTSDTQGGFNVKEGFIEAALPLLNAEGTAKIDLNGAARYSDYSTSGGIWSWKVGGTARLFNDLLLRATKSRDIRSPSIGELFSVRAINIGPLVDQDTTGRTGTPGYSANPQTVTTYTGGNPDLAPEIGKTLTIGGSFSPSFFRGFNLSVDYYKIKVEGFVASLSGALATYIQSYTFDTGLPPVAGATSTRIDSAGDVGSTTGNAIPKWRGVVSLGYQNETFGLDARVRYVDGGAYNHLQSQEYVQSITPGSTAYLVDNHINARIYLDLGAQFKIAERFNLSFNVNNLFDRKPPLSPSAPVYYDAVGRYFSMATRVKF